MEITSLANFLKIIKSPNFELDDFWTIGNATSLSKSTNGEKLNFHRGLLLYALINLLKPKSILENTERSG